MLSQAVENSTLALLPAYTRSATGERLEPSQVFPGRVHSPAATCGLLGSLEYVGTFQSPL